MRCLSFRQLCGFIIVLAALIVGFALGGGSLVPTAQASTAQLAFSPASSSVATGNSVAVNITVANVSNLGGYDVHLQFNPAIVHVATMTDAGFVTSGGNIVACNTATIDNSAGTATEACSTISPLGTPGPGVSTVAPTALLHVSFTGVTVGKSSLTLTGSTLEDPNGGQIAVTLSSGSITVTPATSVGGISELPGPNASPSHTVAAGSSRWSSIPIVLAGGLLAALAVGAGCATLVWRRSRVARVR